MRQRSALTAFLAGSLKLATASSLMLLANCTDFVTGQDPETPGPLLVTRLTLSNPGGNNSSGSSVFTDTSSPQDCSLDALKNTADCVNSPFKDAFSPLHAPPTPDSGTKLRVIFNKLPLKLLGQDVEPVPADALPGEDMLVLSDPSIISLQCEGLGCGVPESYNSLQVNGSDLSPDPTTFDYGPALQMQILTTYDPMAGAAVPPSLMIPIAADPVRALEPGTTYHVVLNPGLSGRNPLDKLLIDDKAKALLTFTTLAFQVVRIGIASFPSMDAPDALPDTLLGDPMCLQGNGITNDPFIAASTDAECTRENLSNDGVIAVYLNAGVDHSVFQSATAIATISVDGATPTPITVKVANQVASDETDDMTCDRGNQRVVYIAPTQGTWAPALADGSSATVSVTLRGADIRDVSQLSGHPAGMGRHVLSGDVVLQGNIAACDTGAPACHTAGAMSSRVIGVTSAAAVNVCP